MAFFDDAPEALESKAYLAYCETLYGRRLRLDGALIEEDLDALLALAGGARRGRILDIGCGSGDLLRFLCRELEAEGVGIDPSPACLAGPSIHVRDDPSGWGADGGQPPRESAANAESLRGGMKGPRGGTETKGAAGEAAKLEARAEGRLSFYRSAAEDCRGVSGSFDLVLAVDSMSACRDAGAALGAMAGFLAPGGAILIAHTERAPDKAGLEFSRSSLARALTERGFAGRGFEIKGRELTRSEKLHWKLSRRLLGALRSGCAAEGKPRVHALVAELTERMTASVERDDFRRYWYRIRGLGRDRR